MIVICGAGITGLTLAEYLSRSGKEYMILEAQSRPGGVIFSERHKGCLLEHGPNTVRMTASLHELLQKTGLADRVLRPDPHAKDRYVLKKGRYVKLPSGPFSLLAGNFFNSRGKFSILREPFRKSEGNSGETVDAFFRRRFGDEVADYVVGPFISGIYAGNSKELLMQEAFPMLLEYEQQHGSVIKGMIKSAKKSKFKGIFSFENGMYELISRLAERHQAQLKLNHVVTGLRREHDKWYVSTTKGEIEATQVVVTLPAYVAAQLIQPLSATFAESLTAIDYPPIAVVWSAFHPSDIHHNIRGFGVLHNTLEPSQTLGTIFSSGLFPSRCEEDTALLTTFLGGARFPEKALRTSEEIQEEVLQDLVNFLKVKGTPKFQKVRVYENGIPQYNQNIVKCRSFFPEWESKGLFFGGNWTGGVAVGNCVDTAKALAKKIMAENA